MPDGPHILSGIFLPYKMISQKPSRVDMLREIISLNQTDLPESTLHIGEDGTLTSRK